MIAVSPEEQNTFEEFNENEWRKGLPAGTVFKGAGKNRGPPLILSFQITPPSEFDYLTLLSH